VIFVSSTLASGRKCMTFGEYNGLLQGSVLILFLKNIIGSCTDRFVPSAESENTYSNIQIFPRNYLIENSYEYFFGVHIHFLYFCYTRDLFDLSWSLGICSAITLLPHRILNWNFRYLVNTFQKFEHPLRDKL
jgi:hypothetical protein